MQEDQERKEVVKHERCGRKAFYYAMSFAEIMEILDAGMEMPCESCEEPIRGVMLGFDLSVRVYS